MSRIERLGLRAKVGLSAVSQTMGGLLIALGGLAVVRITTHRLGPGEYGTFALIVTYVTLFTMLTDLGVTALTTIELGKQNVDRPSVLSSTLSFPVALAIAAIPIIQGSAAVIYPHETSLFRVALAVMSLDVLFTTLQVTLSTVFIAHVRGDRIATLNTLNRAIYVGGVIFVAVHRGSYFDYICAYVGADCLVAILYGIAVNRTIPLRWSSDLGQWWQIRRVALPLGTIQIIVSIYLWIDSIMVSIICTRSQFGFYSLGFNVLAVVLSMPMFLMQALIPSLVNADSSVVQGLVHKASYLLYSVGVLVAVGGVVLRQDAVLALGGPKFLLASTPFAILFVTVPITSLQLVFSYTSLSLDRYRPLLPFAISVLVLNVALNAVLIPKYGPSGAATALVISEFVSLATTYLVFHRLTSVRARWVSLWRPSVAALRGDPARNLGSFSMGRLRPKLWDCASAAPFSLWRT